MGGGSTPSDMPFYKIFGCSALAACTAEIATLPIDTAKVRLQLQGASLAGQAPKYKGMVGTMGTIAKEEGVRALWAGLAPGLHRQCLFGGLRIGMYEPVRNFYMGSDFKGEAPLHMKIAAGLTTGALGITVASPTDLVKVRMQAEGKLPAGATKRYPNVMSAYSIIAKQEGVAGLWTGLVPNIFRNSIVNAAELASYDQFKEFFIGKVGLSDGVGCHILSGLGAGFFAVCVGSPVDVVKSRMMGAKVGEYSNIVDCFVKTAQRDGMGAFYKGFVPNFGRLGSWNVIMFLTLEQAKKFANSM